ncbi:hypothetical protein [Mycobacterium sp. E1715]|uniref:hypothetical protein n=2 Tax=unclassified Mycobacterium TaxID=2642494 RepID=UPI000A5DF63B
MTGGDGTVKSSPWILGGLSGAPEAPTPMPFPVSAGGTSPTDGWRGVLETAANGGVPKDAADAAAADADRRARAADAAAKFPANEAESQQQMQNVGQQAPQMMQQMLQSITGALGGAVGGIMGPLTQLPQQAMQAGQSAIQPLMSAVQGGAHGAGLADESHLVDSVGPGSGAGGGAGLGGGGAGLGGGGGTTPASSLGPPPVPSSSPPTTPAGAAKAVPTPPISGAPTMSGQTGMGGMGMMPPGAMGGHGEGGNKDKPPEKRISAPGVPNGQPVKGRLTMPPSAPGPKPGEEKPTVVTNRPNRRIVIMPAEDEPKE